MVNERPSTNLASPQRVIFGRLKAMMDVFSSMECGSSPSDAIETGPSIGACLDHATLVNSGCGRIIPPVGKQCGARTTRWPMLLASFTIGQQAAWPILLHCGITSWKVE